MGWLTLLDEAGDDAVALLSIAELAKLKVRVSGDKLAITGPKTAGVVAERLISNKPVVMRQLGVTVTETPSIPKENQGNGCGDERFDSWSFPLAPDQVVVGESPIELRWLAYAAAISKRLVGGRGERRRGRWIF